MKKIHNKHSGISIDMDYVEETNDDNQQIKI